MRTIDIETIERFISHHQSALAWCVRDSGGLWEAAELVSEIALHLLTPIHGEMVALDPDDASDAAELLKRLRASARRAAGGRARLVRPDQADTGADWRPGDLRWESLPSDEGAHPLTLLEAIEQSPTSELEFDPYHSELGAWHALAKRVGPRLREMACFLLISTSWCATCRRRARRRALVQHALPPPRVLYEDDDGALRPWRRFRLPRREARRPMQLPLSFGPHPRQPIREQLRLF